MSTVPAALEPQPGDLGLATADPADCGARALAAWEAFVSLAEQVDLAAPARAKGRTGREVVLPLGAWPENRTLADILEDARSGAEPGSGRGHLDHEATEARVRAAHADASADEVLQALRTARDDLAAWLDSGDDEASLRPVPSLLGPLPVLTFLHAAAYQLSVSALDLEPCGVRAPESLLEAGVVALVDTTGALAARQRVSGSIIAVLPGGSWGFGSRDASWRTIEVDLGGAGPPGPAVEAEARVIIDVTAGRVGNVPQLWRERRLVTHDLVGLMRLAPVVEQVPGIPGGAGLRAATRYLGGVGRILGRLPGLPR